MRASSYNTCQRLAAANRAILTFPRVLRNVKAICFFPKNVVYLYSEEEKACKHRAFSSFWLQNCGHFPSEIKISLSASEKFLVASEKFLVAVGARASLSLKFSGPETIKNIKVSQPKKVRF